MKKRKRCKIREVEDLRFFQSEKDCWFMHKVRNHPQIRKHSLNTKPITKKEHWVWWSLSRCKRGNYKYMIEIIRTNEKVGYIRLEDSQLSIALLPEFAGKGYGKEALGLFFKKHCKSKVIALVKTGNEKSLKFFQSVGFEVKYWGMGKK